MTASAQQLIPIGVYAPSPADAQLKCVEILSDNRTLITLQGNWVIAYDAARRTELARAQIQLKWPRDGLELYSVASSPDERLLAVGYQYGAEILSLPSLRHVSSISWTEPLVGAVAFSADGSAVVATIANPQREVYVAPLHPSRRGFWTLVALLTTVCLLASGYKIPGRRL